MTEPATGNNLRTLAIVGGTGKEGKGLAFRWAKAGYRVLIGSRQAEKALAAAEEVNLKLAGIARVEGLPNPEAAEKADLVIVTVPYSAHRATMEGLIPYVQGKIVLDVVVPLAPPKVTKVQMPPAGSAAQEAKSILGENVEVVDAFQNISYEKLFNEEPIECDVLVTGSSKAAREQVLTLVRAVGLIGWDAGPIENSVIVEGMTSILIGLNKQYGVQSAGIKITGIPRKNDAPQMD